jgi:acyl homoserine lactone synthase
MNNVSLIRSDGPQSDPYVLENLFRLRHKVFYETLRWEVNSVNGQERDHYDDLKPVYPVSCDRYGRVTGTMRLLPTTGPYMLADVFPQLLRGEEPPRGEHIWEISRFAVLSPDDPNRERAQAQLNSDTFHLLRCAARFARQQQIEEYVFVTSVALERLLRRLGLDVKRFGDARARKVGKVLSVACRLAIDEHTCRTLHVPFSQTKKRQAA